MPDGLGGLGSNALGFALGQGAGEPRGGVRGIRGRDRPNNAAVEIYAISALYKALQVHQAGRVQLQRHATFGVIQRRTAFFDVAIDADLQRAVRQVLLEREAARVLFGKKRQCGVDGCPVNGHGYFPFRPI